MFFSCFKTPRTLPHSPSLAPSVSIVLILIWLSCKLFMPVEFDWSNGGKVDGGANRRTLRSAGEGILHFHSFFSSCFFDSFILQGQLLLSVTLSVCECTVFFTDYSATDMIKVTEHLCAFTPQPSPACPCLHCLRPFFFFRLFFFTAACVCVCFCDKKMWPFRGVRVIAFITATHCVQPVFDILLMVEQKSSLWKIDAGAR